MNRKRTEIMIEVEEVIQAVGQPSLTRAWCPACRIETSMVPPHSMALGLGVPEREIFRLVEAGMIYFEEAERLVVCPGCYKNSIADGKAV